MGNGCRRNRQNDSTNLSYRLPMSPLPFGRGKRARKHKLQGSTVSRDKVQWPQPAALKGEQRIRMQQLELALSSHETNQIRELINADPGLLAAYTTRNESILHMYVLHCSYCCAGYTRAFMYNKQHFEVLDMLVVNGARLDLRCRNGRAPTHIAAWTKKLDVLEYLLRVCPESVNWIDCQGRTPLYYCISTLSSTLFFEDLQRQLPCIKLLFDADADMLNTMEYVQYKAGTRNRFDESHLENLDCNPDNENDFVTWCKANMQVPLSLQNLCRKIIQKQILQKDENFVLSIKKLDLPPAIAVWISRKLFIPGYTY